MLIFPASILGLGDQPSAFGQTLALVITFIGIGIFVNLLIVYAVFQVMAEHKQNQERQQGFDQ
jgi:energy-converting hydrogenase Eha subunit E